MKLAARVASVFALTMAAGLALAQGYPTKSVTVQEETAMRQTKADTVARTARALPTPAAPRAAATSKLGLGAEPNGAEKRIPGIEHFDMEKWGGESRWNTLRMLRVLRAREAMH